MTIYERLWKKYNNRTVNIARATETKDEIGQKQKVFSIVYTGVSCFIGRIKDKPYDRMTEKVEWTKSTHIVRLPTAYVVRIDDTIIEWNEEYSVRFMDWVADFSGGVDHKVYYLVKIEKWVP